MVSNQFPFQNFPILRTKRLLLRSLELNDAESIFDYARQDHVTKYLLWNTHQSIAETILFIERVQTTMNGINPPIWGIEYLQERKIIGTIGMHRYRREHRRTELGYVLHPSYWNQGIMTEAVRSVLQYSFYLLGLHRVEAGVFNGNHSSEKVLQKVGMTLEGVLRESFFIKNEIRSLKFYALLAKDFRNE